MPGFLVFVIFAVMIFVMVRLAMFKAEQAAKAAQQPPPLPRRAGRARSLRLAAKAAAGQEQEETRAPVAAPAPPERIVVTHPARASVHFDFKGKAALRRAMVAREVLGPPLALRPPRF